MNGNNTNFSTLFPFGVYDDDDGNDNGGDICCSLANLMGMQIQWFV